VRFLAKSVIRNFFLSGVRLDSSERKGRMFVGEA